MAKLAPSILSADFSKLAEELYAVEKAGADYVHIDVMDGHFVPNISFGAQVMKCLEGKIKMPFDVHLMIEDPGKYIKDFVTDDTEYITVHQEACAHLDRMIEYIRSFGIKAGVSINPATPEGIEYCALFGAESQRFGKQLSHWAWSGRINHKRGDGFPGNGTAGSKTRLIAEYLCGVIVQLLHRPYTI